MGTSKDSSGSGGRSPLVPAHADATPGQPVPERPPNGLANFRRSLTGFARSGNSQFRDCALGRYARGAIGGSAVGYRRYGGVADTGSAAIGVLSDLASGGTGEATAGRDVSEAIGAPVETAAQIIAEAIAPDNAEGDDIRILVQEAICEALQEQETLERDLITEAFLDQVLFEYTVEAIMQDLWSREGSPSLDAAPSPQALQARETEMRDAVRAVVDSRLVAQRQDRQLVSMSQAERRQLQLDTIRAVLEVWEALPE